MTEPLPCVLCSQETTHRHHMETRGRRPDLVDDPENLCPACDECHDWLEPEGEWRVRRVDTQWVVTDVQNGEEICCRPAEVKESQALAIVTQVSDLLDYRKEKDRLLAFLSSLTDNDLLLVNEKMGRVHESSARARGLSQYEAWRRYAFKERPDWADRLGKSFGVAAQTIRENVHTARVFADDEGPAMGWSFYVLASHQNDPQAALATVRGVWEGGGKLKDAREALGLTDERESCVCAECGHEHRKKGEDT